MLVNIPRVRFSGPAIDSTSHRETDHKGLIQVATAPQSPFQQLWITSPRAIQQPSSLAIDYIKACDGNWVADMSALCHQWISQAGGKVIWLQSGINEIEDLIARFGPD